ncbi:acetylglutamate kinase [Nitritalea halalkaliphila LW7]|uniref:Acetylglutamate kinase n=1 Tax=Nitritalea halalkaliphila LW7 TaxID=1189621 RepID=I5C2A2_9BACT|nr:acetylglutamate kinase [Nitritalea halalkaliphila]EIM75954.1 acetylglutamate kinase [Nitritalea halalkaliphila LW7]
MKLKKVLIKYGGNAMTTPSLQTAIAREVAGLRAAGYAPIIAHGGGPFIQAALQQANIPSHFVQGQRYTSQEALQVITRTLIGQVNADLVVAFRAAGMQAVGLSGLDAGMVQAKRKLLPPGEGELTNAPLDLGEVGEITATNPALLEHLLENGFTPIVACIAGAADKEGAYNVNGDDFAAALAAALKAEIFLILSDVDGLYREYPNPESLIHDLPLAELEGLYGKVISGGMIPKMQACARAIAQGLGGALLLNGTKPEQFRQYFIEKRVVGTHLHP